MKTILFLKKHKYALVICIAAILLVITITYKTGFSAGSKVIKENNTSMVKSFVNNNYTATVSQNFMSATEYIDIPYFKPGYNFTLCDIRDILKENNFSETDKVYITSVYMAKINGLYALKLMDVGIDSPSGKDGSYCLLVFRNNGEKLELCFAADGWPRSSITVNPYGYICSSGSAGAAHSCFNGYFIKADGTPLLLNESETMFWDSLGIVNRKADARFRQTYEEQPFHGDISVTIEKINGTKYTSYNMEYIEDVPQENSDNAIIEEFRKTFEKYGTKFTDSSIVKEKYKTYLQENGIKEEWLAGKEVKWTKIK